MNSLRFTFASLSCVLLVACGSASTSSSVASPHGTHEEEPKVAGVWRSKCGACHVPVEPGSHSREQLETALSRHRKRVRLSEDQWAELVDFLAMPKQQAAK